jgi:hypothetical protein
MERARQRRQEGGPRRKRGAQRPHARALHGAVGARRLCGHCAGGRTLVVNIARCRSRH